MRKSAFVILLTMILGSTSYAQFRYEKDTNDIVIKEVRSTLDKATGYIYLGGGEWESAKNKIPFIVTNKSAEAAAEAAALKKSEERKVRRRLKATSGEKKLGKENFKVMELRDMVLNGQAFQVLQVKYTRGRYEFPIIKEGFNTYETMDYYVFRSEQLKDVFPNPLVFNKPYIVNLKVFVSEEIPYYYTKDVEAMISKKVRSSMYDRNLESFSTTNLLMALYPVVEDGEKKLQFNLIRSYNKDYVIRSYYKKENLEELFHTKYYETEFDAFKDFIGSPAITFMYSDKEPTTFEGFCDLGVNQYNYGDYYNSVANLNKALRMKPDYDHYALYSHRANAKYKMGDLYGALDDYNRALDLKPVDPEQYKEWLRNYLNRGTVKLHLGDKSDACSDWKRAYEKGLKSAKEVLEEYCQ